MDGLTKFLGRYMNNLKGDSESQEAKAEEDQPQNVTKDFRNDTFFSGYLPVDTEGQDMFYTLFESRTNETRDTDPLIMYIRGEPGCGASGTYFDRNSPYNLVINETLGQPDVILNPISWNNFSNVLYLDTPVGTGYSFPRSSDEALYNMDTVVNHFARFAKQFFSVHERFRNRPFYIIGQDFSAGKYIPAFVKALKDLQDGNFSDKEYDAAFFKGEELLLDEWINLKGLVLINPLIDAVIQKNLTIQYSIFKKLVDDVDVFFMGKATQWCFDAIESGHFWEQILVCGISEAFAMGNPIYPSLNSRNIRKECENWLTCWSNDPLTQQVMNMNDIVTRLGANTTSDSIWGDWQWTDCNLWDGYKVQNDYSKTFAQIMDLGETSDAQLTELRYSADPKTLLQEILEERELKILVLAGDLDFQNNHMGVETVLKGLEWQGRD
mmetsp:Transcript_10032/g.16884  ORF Transcript_10032/g.16884 Transcript_10032/m.16884 type:complete len:438 (+) Transcript_10032:126-1439(+)